MMRYKNPNLTVEERLDDLMRRMSFEQKIDQITCLVTITSEIPDFKEYVPDGIGNVGAFTVADKVEDIVEYAYRLQKFLVEETPLGIPALIHCEASAGAQFTEADVSPALLHRPPHLIRIWSGKWQRLSAGRCTMSDSGRLFLRFWI